MTRIKSSRLLIRKMKLLLLSRLIKKLLSNKIFIINILLYYNYSLNKKIKNNVIIYKRDINIKHYIYRDFEFQLKRFSFRVYLINYLYYYFK